MNSKPRKRKQQSTVTQENAKCSKLDVPSITPEQELFNSIRAEQDNTYKNIVHDMLISLIQSASDKDYQINRLRELQSNQHKWSTSMYTHIIQSIIPFFMTTSENATEKYKGEKTLIQFFRLNKNWNRIMKCNSIIWNQYFQKKPLYTTKVSRYIESQAIDCTIYYLTNVKLHIMGNKIPNQIQQFTQYIQRFKCLKVVSIEFFLNEDKICKTPITKRKVLDGLKQLGTVLHDQLHIQQLHIEYNYDDDDSDDSDNENHDIFTDFSMNILTCFHPITSLDLFEIDTLDLTEPYPTMDNFNSLKELKIFVTSSTTTFYKYFLEHMTHTIEVLDISIRSIMMYSTVQEYLHIIKQCICLRNIRIIYEPNSPIVLNMLQYFPDTLQTLYLSNVGVFNNLGGYYASNTYTVFSQMKSLTIYCKNESDIPYLVHFFPNVEFLKIGGLIKTSQSVKLLQTLKHLNHLIFMNLKDTCIKQDELFPSTQYRNTDLKSVESIQTFFNTKLV